jgi:hypothetical protein
MIKEIKSPDIQKGMNLFFNAPHSEHPHRHGLTLFPIWLKESDDSSLKGWI